MGELASVNQFRQHLMGRGRFALPISIERGEALLEDVTCQRSVGDGSKGFPRPVIVLTDERFCGDVWDAQGLGQAQAAARILVQSLPKQRQQLRQERVSGSS
jgi:hypothetical protein